LPRQCQRCQAALPLELARILERRQVIDVPAPSFDVIEHCTLGLTCACGQTHESAFPQEVKHPVQYGPNVRSLGVHLTQGQMLAFARAAELIQDVWSVQL
jgi:transposase